MLRILQEDAAHDGNRDGLRMMIDGGTVRAHQHGAGARRAGAPIWPWAAVASAMAARCTRSWRVCPSGRGCGDGRRHERPQAIPLLERAQDRMWLDAIAGDNGHRAGDDGVWTTILVSRISGVGCRSEN